MTRPRDVPAQQGPPADPAGLCGFPEYRAAKGTLVHRAHLATRGPWWFSHDGAGRFDLPAPRGTCYLASTALAALRERLGPVLSMRAALPRTTLEGVVVSRLTCGPQRWANLRVTRAADFGVTRELESMTPYDVPQRWARALDLAGFGGVRYGPRFSPGAASAIASFGAAGEHGDLPADPRPTPADQVPGAPRPLATPARGELTVVHPPSRAGRPASRRR